MNNRFNAAKFLNVVNSRKGAWKQNFYKLQHPEKYMSSEPPFYRSSWEQRVFYMMDTNVNVIRWGSEILEIPYSFSLQATGNKHKYFVDIYAEIKENDGNIVKYAIEIKPKQQCSKPEPPKKKSAKALKNYLYSASTYVKNQNKWKAAEAFCLSKGYKFVIWDESNIF